MPLKLSIVIPFYNEEEGAGAFLDELKAVLSSAPWEYEIVAVDDGSSDGTFWKLRAHATTMPSLRVIRLSRNFGHQNALMAGLDAATGDAVVTIDGDAQDPPATILDLVRKFEEGFDVVYAVRSTRPGEPFWRRGLIYLFYRVLHRISRLEVPVDAGDFRLMSRRAVDQLRGFRDANPYLRGGATWVGFRQTVVTYDRRARTIGESKYSLWKLMQLGWNGVTTMSHFPLKLSMILGLAVSLVSFVLAVLLIVGSLFFLIDPRGWTSLIVAVLFMGGIQMLMIGILGEYIGRIHEDVKKRPLYVIQDKVNLP